MRLGIKRKQAQKEKALSTKKKLREELGLIGIRAAFINLKKLNALKEAKKAGADISKVKKSAKAQDISRFVILRHMVEEQEKLIPHKEIVTGPGPAPTFTHAELAERQQKIVLLARLKGELKDLEEKIFKKPEKEKAKRRLFFKK